MHEVKSKDRPNGGPLCLHTMAEPFDHLKKYVVVIMDIFISHSVTWPLLQQMQSVMIQIIFSVRRQSNNTRTQVIPEYIMHTAV